jgi:hypothetical protein
MPASRPCKLFFASKTKQHQGAINVCLVRGRPLRAIDTCKKLLVIRNMVIPRRIAFLPL